MREQCCWKCAMKILLLTRAVPYPPDSGPKIKTYHLLRYLASRHEVTLVSLSHHADDHALVPQLRELCAAVHLVPHQRSVAQCLLSVGRSLVRGQPYSIECDLNQAMANFVEQLVFAAASTGKPYDLVHADQLSMAQYAARLPIPRLLDMHTVMSASYARLSSEQPPLKRLLYAREARLLRRYEAALCQEFEAITVVSEDDRQWLLEAQPHSAEISIVPIGIDVASLPPVERDLRKPTVLSLASMDWLPNLDGALWFARTIYPLVRRAVPEARLFVCGPFRNPEVAALADSATQIEVTGYVSDPQPYLEQASCLIVPQRGGGGLQVKILEALARGVPVVATSLGCKGIDLVDGRHVLMADTASEFADAVSLLLQEPEFGCQLARAGQQQVLERYDWRAVYPAIEYTYNRMLARRTMPGQALAGPTEAMTISR
jgi:polysaccharide biosynthesis protein PslH